MSEEERQRGEVPDVFAPTGTASGKRTGNPRWPYLLSAVLVLNLAVLVAWLRPWEPHGPMEQRPLPPPSATAPARAGSSPIPVAGSTAANRAPDSGPGPGALTTKQLGPGSSGPATPGMEPRTPERTSHSAAAAASGTGAAGETVAGPGRTPAERLEKTAAVPVLQAGAGEPAREPPSADAEKRGVTPPAPKGNQLRRPPRKSVPTLAPPDPAPEAPEGSPTVAAAAPAVTVEKPRPPGIHALPDPIKAGLPDIAFSFHLYSRKPPERRVRVNGKTVGEGERITDELHVAEITRDGAILEMRGHRFLMEVREVWRAR